MPEDSLEILLQIREHQQQLKLQEMEFRKEAAAEYARMALAHQLQSQQFMKDYGQMAIRSLFLLNGGALVSLITLMGSISSYTFKFPKELVPTSLMAGFPWFLFGLFFAVVMMFMAYLNYGEIARSKSNLGALANAIIKLKDVWPHNSTDGGGFRILWTYRGAIVAGLASLLCFFAGCLKIMGPASTFWYPGMIWTQ